MSSLQGFPVIAAKAEKECLSSVQEAAKWNRKSANTTTLTSKFVTERFRLFCILSDGTVKRKILFLF